MNNSNKNQIDIKDTAIDFCNWYYTNMSSKGIASVSHIFSSTASCIYDNIGYNSYNDIMIMLLSEGINRIEYGDMTFSYTLIDNNTLMIQSYGICSGISYNNKIIGTSNFTETFILKHIYDKKESKLCVSNYIFKFL